MNDFDVIDTPKFGLSALAAGRNGHPLLVAPTPSNLRSLRGIRLQHSVLAVLVNPGRGDRQSESVEPLRRASGA